MPELKSIYETLVELAGGGDLAARFLTIWCPPAYMTGCTQATWPGPSVKLIRNYDYHPKWCEGTLLYSDWCKPVIAMTDSMWGVLDGINIDGLAASLAFGGRKVVGEGFGITLVLRYLLETCSSTGQAIETLKEIPVHMAYNVQILDAHGASAVVYLNPDREAVISTALVSTNHQEYVEWPDYAQFSQTVERQQFLEKRLADPAERELGFISHFLQPPIFQNQFEIGFGTLYTVVYDPSQGKMSVIWPHHAPLNQAFLNFKELRTVVNLRKRKNNRK